MKKPEQDLRRFIQRAEEVQDVLVGPPVAITRVQVTVPESGQARIHVFVGTDAETDANACLVEHANSLSDKSPAVRVAVVTTTGDGCEYHAWHHVTFCDPDGTVRGRIAYSLKHFLVHEAYRRHYGHDEAFLRRCLVAVTGVPDQVLRAEILRLYALKEQTKHTLRQCLEYGMEEYYALLVRFLELGCKPDEAVLRARKEAEEDFLPDVSAPFALPDPEVTEYLCGVEAACKEAQHYLVNLPPEAQA